MAPSAAEDLGGLGEDSIDIGALCEAKRWSRSRLIREMRRVASESGRRLPSDDSLTRMIRQWVNGSRSPGAEYAALLAGVFGVVQVQTAGDQGEEFLSLVDRGDAAADHELVAALEAQTQSLRVLDRRLGARRLLDQAIAHARNVTDLVQWCPPGAVQRDLAAAGAEASALAGWQALDLGRPRSSWKLHAQARSLARESSNEGIVAHVTAQQAYALLDAGRTDRAVAQFAAARHQAAGKTSGTVTAWLAAAEAEGRAARGDQAGTLQLLDEAASALTGEEVPFIVLDASHLARWRGHCLAQLGDSGAIQALGHALEVLDPAFRRAAAGLHADLANAHQVKGDRDAVRHHSQKANQLSDNTGSARQRARVKTLLLNAEGEKVQ